MNFAAAFDAFHDRIFSATGVPVELSGVGVVRAVIRREVQQLGPGGEFAARAVEIDFLVSEFGAAQARGAYCDAAEGRYTLDRLVRDDGAVRTFRASGPAPIAGPVPAHLVADDPRATLLHDRIFGAFGETVQLSGVGPVRAVIGRDLQQLGPGGEFSARLTEIDFLVAEFGAAQPRGAYCDATAGRYRLDRLIRDDGRVRTFRAFGPVAIEGDADMTWANLTGVSWGNGASIAWSAAA